MILSSVPRHKTAFLPYCGKSCFANNWQSFSPEKARSLGDRNLDLCHKNLAVQAARDFGFIGDFKK